MSNKKPKTIAELETCSLSIAEFCRLENISKPTYFKIRKLGQGPAETRFGDSVRISQDARCDWHKKLQNPNRKDVREQKARLVERAKLAVSGQD